MERWRESNNGVALHAIVPPQPSNRQSRHSGGTSDILPNERKRATFSVESLTNIIDGGIEATRRRRFIMSPNKNVNVDDKYNWTRQEYLSNHVKHFLELHEDFAGTFRPTRDDVSNMTQYQLLHGALMNHFGVFLPAFRAAGSDEQHKWWIDLTQRQRFIGCYAQTELGHGSNVRGLQSTAEYDPSTQEFVLNTPTLQSMKWWPGALGKVATHALFYAQLIIAGKEYGVHAFLVQIRDENHRPLPGCEIGDLGAKIGDDASDTGFLRLFDVRVPRQHMMERYQRVTPEGKYEKAATKTNDKVGYMSMLIARSALINSASGWLARACVIVARYSCVRHQGFVDTATTSYRAPEKQIIDHQMQRFRVIKQIAFTYAMKFTGKWFVIKFGELRDKSGNVNASALPEIAATASGLKGMLVFETNAGIEDLRKCCGGNGYLKHSGIGQLAADYIWQPTAEGDTFILLLQLARYLIKTWRDVTSKGTVVTGPCAYMSKASGSHSFQPPTVIADFFDIYQLKRWFDHRAMVAVRAANEGVAARLKAGAKADEAFNDCAIQLIESGKLHCHAFILSNFVDILANSEDVKKDKQVHKVLTRLCCLYAAGNIIEDQWFGLFSIDNLHLARSAVNQLLAEIRPDVIALTDAFEFPDNVLASSIGSFDGNVYENLFLHALNSSLNRSDPYQGYQVAQKFFDKNFIALKNTLPSKL